jgi:uracil-DNA glycosylase family protein
VKTTLDYLPKSSSLKTLTQAVQNCKGCDLYKNATQAVFGEGKKKAQVVLMGEQPGDKEDLEGKPFIGPAGKILSKACTEAGLARDQIYVTNAVKHFKYERTGKKRIHQKPNSLQIEACAPWWQAELSIIKPRVIVCLGATAIRAVLGSKVKVTKDRGKSHPTPHADFAVVSFHPSAILRQPTEAGRDQYFQYLVEDLRLAKSLAKS